MAELRKPQEKGTFSPQTLTTKELWERCLSLNTAQHSYTQLFTAHAQSRSSKKLKHIGNERKNFKKGEQTEAFRVHCPISGGPVLTCEMMTG